jgi:putative FmdB family regulatory protein
MPTYDFRCEACGHRFERFLPITAEDPKSCPVCGGGPIKRLPSSGAGVIFKGPGFHATDYRPESYKKAEKREREQSASAKGGKAGAKTHDTEE